MRLVVDNKQILFKGPPALRKRVDERTAYRVEGYRFNPAYRARQWDGKEHLAKHVKDGLYRAPVGMLDEITKVAAAMDLEWTDVIDNRREPSLGSVRTKWDHIDFEIRPYQDDAVEAIMATRGYQGLGTGKGLIDIATRGGKTVVVLYAIHRLGVPSLILVQSERVMKQTVALARKILKVPVGIVGAGVWKPQDITVASVQTLVRHSDKQHCRELMRSFDLVNFDECISRGTLIRYGDGTSKRVEDVRPGDLVATPTGPRRVLRVIDRGIRRVIGIRTESGAMLRCTPDHPIAMERGGDAGWMEAQEANASGPVHMFRVRDGGDQLGQRGSRQQLHPPRGGIPANEGDARCLLFAREGVCTSDRVVSVIDLISPLRVYDLEVEDARCFYANDLLVHNCHHLQGKKWRACLEMCDAWYKVGTSATIFLHRKKETPKGTIWMRAATGPVLYKISPSELIKQGYLVPPTIELFTVDGPKVSGGSWDEIYDRGIVNHHVRNSKVSGKAGEYHERGLTVLVNVRLHDHVDVLEEYLKDLGLKVTVVIGPTSSRERDRRIKAFVNRRVDVMLGTIFKEGVDIPEIEGVVNAAGGKSKIAAIQQFRNLTPSHGKSTAVLADAMDLHNPTLAKHSLERLKVYRAHEMFEVEATR